MEKSTKSTISNIKILVEGPGHMGGDGVHTVYSYEL